MAELFGFDVLPSIVGASFSDVKSRSIPTLVTTAESLSVLTLAPSLSVNVMVRFRFEGSSLAFEKPIARIRAWVLLTVAFVFNAI